MGLDAEYGYGDVLTITTTRGSVPNPAIDKIFKNKLFTLTLLNTGANDIEVYPIDSNGADPIKILVPASAGQISEQFGWSSLAGGIEAIALVGSSTLNVQIYSRNGPIEAVPPVVTEAISGIISVQPRTQEAFLQVKTFPVS